MDEETVERLSSGLWEYPRALARLLYGEVDAKEVSARVCRFAATDQETQRYDPSGISDIVNMLLSGRSRGPSPLQRRLRRSLARFAYAASDAQARWRERNGVDSDEGLFVIVGRLSHCVDREDASLSTSLENVAGYGLRIAKRDVVLLLARATDGFVTAYSWDALPETLLAHLCVCAAGNLPSTARNAVEIKLARDGADAYALAWLLRHSAEVRKTFLLFLKSALGEKGLEEFVRANEIVEEAHRILQWVVQIAQDTQRPV